MKFWPMGVEIFHADGRLDGQTDRQTDMTELQLSKKYHHQEL